MKTMQWVRVVLIVVAALGLSLGERQTYAQEVVTPVGPAMDAVAADSSAEIQADQKNDELEKNAASFSEERSGEKQAMAPQEETDESGMELMLFGEEIMVMTATKRLQKLSEVPGSVTIITEQEIRERGALTLKDVLQNLTSIEIAYEGLMETLRFRGMQGSYNNKVLLLVNGRKVNTIDWGDINHGFDYNLDNVQQIEIVKGPGSSLYGANAFAGVINIITKDGKSINGVNSKVSVGSKPGDPELSQYYLLNYGNKRGDYDYSVSGGYWRQFGLDPINTETPNEIFEGNRIDVALKYKDALEVRSGYHKNQSPMVGSVYSPTPDTVNFIETVYLDAKYNFDMNEISNMSIRVEDTYTKNTLNQVVQDIQRQKIETIDDLPPGVMMLIDEFGVVSPVTDAVGGYYIDLENFMNLQDGTAFVESMINRGPLNEFLAEVQYDLSWPQNNYLIAGVNLTHDFAHLGNDNSDGVSDQSYAAYLQDEYHMMESLILLAGVRYDYNTDYGTNISPRGSLIYTPMTGLQFKALYGSAFRAPVLLERYADINYGFYEATGNKALKPEQIDQSEASIEYKVGKWLQLKGGYFYWETENEIQFDYNFSPLVVYSPNLSWINPMMPALPGLFYAEQLNLAPSDVSWSNANSRIAHGVELEGTVRPIPYTQLKVNYSRFNLYSRNQPQHPSWAEGDADMLNAMLGLNYENLFFVNMYAHFGRIPNQVSTATGLGFTTETKAKWLSQYDISVGGMYQGVSLTVAVFNVFENAMTYDTLRDDYLKGERIVRINAEYTYKF